MAIIFGDRNNNIIAAINPGDTIFGLSGVDVLSSTFGTADLRGGWGADAISVNFDEIVGNDGVSEGKRWSLSGDQGSDSLKANIQISSSENIDYNNQLSGYIYEIILEGGDGDDYIESNFDFNFLEDFHKKVYSSIAALDISGNNNLIFRTALDMYTDPNNYGTSHYVVLGDGNDNVESYSYAVADNYHGQFDGFFDLGSGLNTLKLNDFSGFCKIQIQCGDGEDYIDLKWHGYNANDNGSLYNGIIATGGGDDTVNLELGFGNFSTYSAFSHFYQEFDFGEGNNRLQLFSRYAGFIEISAGNGSDIIKIVFKEFQSDGASDYAIDCRLGDGDNILEVEFEELGRSFFDHISPTVLFSGSGHDLIKVKGGFGSTISSGGGSDTISAGSGDDTISGGTGGDRVTLAKGIFDAGASQPQDRLTLTDFSLADADRLVLTGFTLAGTIADGIIDTAADLAALRTAAGDVLSFVQQGADALLTLALAPGEVAEILFRGLTIPTVVLDPPLSFTGTTANNVFSGGNNADQFFLKLGQDRATGNDGADLFRVNAVTSHNRNGDRHTITDLDFAEGDVIRFDNFGAGWASNAADPLNDLQYVAGSFNNWFVDSVADLRELRTSGAITTAALAGANAGTRISFEDQAGDDVSIDLWGIFV